MIGRYLYNIELARTLYAALNWAEVTLRNHLHTVISQAYPLDASRSFVRVESWLDADPPVLLPREQERVRQAMEGFDRRHPPPRRPGEKPTKVLTEGRLIAELHFGFWTHLLDGSYANWRVRNSPLFWPKLLDRAFPHCPPLQRTRKEIHGRFTEIKEIRNRTFHHERISHLANLDFYDRTVEAIHWIDPVLADGLHERERPRFQMLIEAGPQPFIEWAASEAGLYLATTSGLAFHPQVGEDLVQMIQLPARTQSWRVIRTR